MKNKYYLGTGLILLVVAWSFGFAHGKVYWGKRYDWLNDGLRTDIQNCRDTLNQCKRDLAEPEHCVSYVVENIENICGDCYAE